MKAMSEQGLLTILGINPGAAEFIPAMVEYFQSIGWFDVARIASDIAEDED